MIIRRLAALLCVLTISACSDKPTPSPLEVHIPMPDGVTLAADLYLPDGDDVRHPVLLEYLPYRKMESRARNLRLYSYFVERGYAVVRVDIRGTGNSEGRLIPYEYSDIELDDGEAVIAWLAEQEWSSGDVGMFGISWGGFNAIQLAGRQPPALKAFIAVDATEDLYEEDVHYIDGILHVDSWLMSQEVDNSRPGAPGFQIDEAYFRNRFDTEPWTLTYLRQQRDGPFWDRASMRDAHDEIRIPSLQIGGWYDGYRDSVPRMLERVPAPVKAIVGAWTHAFPHEPWPEPGIEWRQVGVDFFDHYLKGADNGYEDRPDFAVYVRDWHPPEPSLGTIDGHWRAEDGWPLERGETLRLYANAGHGLADAPAAAATHELDYRAASGIQAGGPVMWWGDIAPDQQPTDDLSLVYDSEPLAEDLEILGLPLAKLNVAADAPQANWFVRLSDVAPDGQVTLITGAGFNGTHRNSSRSPELLTSGEFFPLDVQMHFTSWIFPKGHRIRLSIGNAQWPMFWPTPYPATTQLQVGGNEGARLDLPVVPAGPETLVSFPPPAGSPQLPGYRTLDSGNASGYGEVSAIAHDPETGEAVVTLENRTASAFPWGEETWDEWIEHRTSDADPARTSVRGRHSIEVQLEDRLLRWEGDFHLRSDRDNLYYNYTRTLRKDGEVLREKHWTDTIPRDYQ